jgi:heterodisulfide reductase subunit C
MDYTPRQLWRMVLTGQAEKIFTSQTFFLCSACYSCSLRCPRGLPLTDAMSALKEIAVTEKLSLFRKSAAFYESFMESVRRHGRVREMEFMTLYFSSLKNPFFPMKYTPLAIKLLAKRKLALQWPSRTSAGSLAPMFRKAQQLEANL